MSQQEEQKSSLPRMADRSTKKVFFRNCTIQIEVATRQSSCYAAFEILCLQCVNFVIRYCHRFSYSKGINSKWKFTLGPGLNYCYFCSIHLCCCNAHLANCAHLVSVWIKPRKTRSMFQRYLAISIPSPLQVS